MSEFYSEYPFDLYDKSLLSSIYLLISNTLERSVYTETEMRIIYTRILRNFVFFMHVESIFEYFTIFNFIIHIMLKRKKKYFGLTSIKLIFFCHFVMHILFVLLLFFTRTHRELSILKWYLNVFTPFTTFEGGTYVICIP